MKNISNNLNEQLNGFIEKNVLIIQNGFMESRYSIHKLKYFIEDDILNIIDENDENYLKLNLNQIYNIDNREKEIILYLDNDTILIFKY